MSAPVRLTAPAPGASVPTPAAPQVGDVIFWRPDADDALGRVIAAATSGPYFHTGVLWRADPPVAISAASDGVHTRVCAPPFPADCARVAEHCPELQRGLDWLQEELGRPYSYRDVAEAALELALQRLCPQVPGVAGSAAGAATQAAFAHLCALLRDNRAFDCASLVARYLAAAGLAWLPAAVRADPDVVSPNELARALRVLP